LAFGLQTWPLKKKVKIAKVENIENESFLNDSNLLPWEV
jgi:hypothetical protein